MIKDIIMLRSLTISLGTEPHVFDQQSVKRPQPGDVGLKIERIRSHLKMGLSFKMIPTFTG
jgi:hypothetical protein